MLLFWFWFWFWFWFGVHAFNRNSGNQEDRIHHAFYVLAGELMGRKQSGL